MKVAILAPISLLEDYCTFTNYHICKPELLLSSKLYRDFYIYKREQRDYLILDCSNSEPRHSIPPKELFEVAELLKPDLVVAPDWDMNSTKTVELSVEFLNAYKSKLTRMGVKILGMVQGATLEQCLLSYRSLNKLVDAIGLPRSIEAAIGRSNFLKKIRTNKPIHLFGIHASPEKELESLLNLNRENLIGISTDLPIRLGFSCRLLDEFRPEPPPLDYYSASNPFPGFTRENVEEFIEMAEG